MKTNFKQYYGKNKRLLILMCISFVIIGVLTGCSSTPVPVSVLTSNKFEILECPTEAYIGDYILVSGRTTFKTQHELLGKRGGNIYFEVFREESYPDTENVVRWYVQIPEKTKIGVVTLEIRVQVESDRYKTVFSRNVIIKESTLSVNPAPVPELPLSPTPVPLSPAPPHSFPTMDSFNLEPLDEEINKEYSGWFPSRYPFNEFGIYINRLSFVENETLDITITADQPISIKQLDEIHGGLYVDIQFMKSETSSRASSSWYKSYDLYKSGTNWEVRIIFNPDQTGIYSLSFINRGGRSSWGQYTISLHTPSSTTNMNTENEVATAVLDYLSSLATTSEAKQFLAEFKDNVLDTGFLVLDSEGVSHKSDNYQGQDIRSYAVEFAFSGEATLRGVLRNETTAGWEGSLMPVKLCSWLVELDGTVQPRNSNALRVEIYLTSSSTLIWTYPELSTLGISADPDFFHETVPREVLENPEWDPIVLENKVKELAKEYVKAHPYLEPFHVCREMAVELWQVLKDNNITSLIVVGNTEDQKEWRISFKSDHAWLVVLGRNNLQLGVESTSGVVYSPNYMRAFEVDSEFAYWEHGPASPQWEAANAAYDYFYTEYEQHLEGYYYLSPVAFYGSTIFWFFPSNW